MAMKSLGDLLSSAKIVKKIDKKSERRERLFEAWGEIKDKACLEHTKKLFLKNGVLYITMDSQVWQQELLFQDEKEIVDKMKQISGFNIVKLRIKT